MDMTPQTVKNRLSKVDKYLPCISNEEMGGFEGIRRRKWMINT